MDNLNPGSDESILKRLPRIIVSGVRYEAALTSRRMILAERETGIIREDIPYSSIALAVSGLNSIREPVLAISINTDGGEQRSIELIFVYQPGGMNVQNIESCVEILQDHHVTVQKTKSLNAAGAMTRVQALTPGMQTGKEGQSRPAVPDMGLFGTLRHDRELPPEESSKTPYFIAIAVIVVIIAVIAAGAFIAGQGPGAGVPEAQPQSTAPAVTDTPVITPPPAMTIPVPPAPATQPPQMAVPANGIWVRISFAGSYTGTLAAQGWGMNVNSSGTQVYQLPVHDTMIHGFIEKGEGSAGKLEVWIYNGGTLVSGGETTKPYGMVELHVPVGPAAGGAVIPAPAPEIQISPYASLPKVSIPPTGVWVRVFYPGNYIGSIRANGQIREVNSTGDQFYQFPIASGTIDGSIEKQDGSADNLMLVVYKNGAMVSQSFTSVPLGVAEVHTGV
jgi:hypothetical protein